MVNMLEYNITVSKFKHLWCYYVHFRINTIVEVMEPRYGFNIFTSAPLQVWLGIK